MSLLSSGVSGGVAVTNQTAGVLLTTAGDYAQILIGALAPGQGPDNFGFFVISGTYPAATVLLQQVVTPAAYAAGSWTAIQGAIPQSTGTANYTGTVALAANQVVNFALPQVQGLYAVRVYLPATLTTGGVLVTGQTYPAVSGVPSPLTLAADQNIANMTFAVALAMMNETGQDYLALAQGSSYP